jgi:uncharacterized RDD family membrane protein YckC
MPYCEHCGAKYEKGEEICPKCGVRLNIILLDAKRLEIERKRRMVELRKRGYGRGPVDVTTRMGVLCPPDVDPEVMKNARRASFSDRAIAKLIDSLIVGIVPNILLPVVGGILAGALYYVNFYISRGQTPGMILTGIKVVSADGYKITTHQALKRYAAFTFLSGLPTVGLGYLMYFRNPERQTLHDRIANTYVISLEEQSLDFVDDNRGSNE